MNAPVPNYIPVVSRQPHRLIPCPRLERAVDRMVREMSSPLTLADLADAAHYSPWYLVRRFQNRYNTTPQAFLWKIRLETAASLLHWAPHLPIGEVARQVGFSSAATFSRAFHREFGFTPSAWRKGEPETRDWLKQTLGPFSYQPGKRIAGTAADYVWSFDEVAAKITVEEWPAMRFLYQREVGDYGCHLNEQWTQFAEFCRRNQLDQGQLAMYGLIWSDPSTTPAGRRRYDTAVAIKSGTPIPRGFGECRLLGGRWAVFAYYGMTDDIGPRWRDLMHVWLPRAGLTPDLARPRVERNRSGFGDGHIDLCMPVL
ncbi:AraC family transcriptional regulator [Jeongeupia naejangsanensis]|uniref:AraC family transcriptional regulator n=1 Tax=Jeongeupia naejangsanensis TaxID=613195 RepID=A0ABS2BLF4_9NEIS|nr:AraC family transcriptional regulator [Jeongeupia naejangsanensis]MBM3116442.1 AraC family transcriptional regulator [Jeongeupia naejangsanensis]